MSTPDALIARAPAPADPAPAPARSRPAPRSSSLRVTGQPAFVLHSYPYKETSLIVDVLTRHHGRVALIARGAKRPRSALRGVLLAFQPLVISWVQGRARAASGAQGGGDLRTMTRAEWMGGLRPLRGEALMSGFYLNELVQKLVARDDPHEALFDAYLQALAVLSEDRPAAPVLRHFEVALLREAGYAVRLEHAADGSPIEPLARYRYVPEQGAVRVERAADDDVVVSGKTLLDIDNDDYTDPVTLGQSRRLMRHLLDHQLGGQALHTRDLVHELRALDARTARPRNVKPVDDPSAR
jgi:DNA repair protein RecO (recombination protein O)